MGVLKYRDPETGEWVAAGGVSAGDASGPHAASHAADGEDPVTPAMIGAPTVEEMNDAIEAAIGAAIGGSY